MNFIVIDGNHDVSSRSGQGSSALKALDTEQNIQVIHTSLEDPPFYYVPWSATMVKDIKNKPESCKYLVAHLGLNEAQLNSGISIVSDIGAKDLVNYEKVFLGHYHQSQQLGNIFYIGSLIQRDWGEKDDEKRFIIFDDKTGKIQSIPTEGYKKHFELELTKENYKEVLEQANILEKEGNHIKLVKTEDFETKEIEGKFNIIEKFEKELIGRGITSTMSTKQKLDRYLEVRNVSDENKEKYKQIALEIIQEIN
jgi:DNA repair exonuclease SbcCD nuclease subunit